MQRVVQRSIAIVFGASYVVILGLVHLAAELARRLAQTKLRLTRTKLRLRHDDRRLAQTTVRLSFANRHLAHANVRLGEPEFHLPKMKLLHNQTNVPLREAEHGVAELETEKIDRGFVQNAISSP